MPARNPAREAAVLVVLLAVLAVVVVYQLRTWGTPGGPATPVQAASVSSRVAIARDRVAAVPQLRLSALRTLSAMPVPSIGRNPFRERPVAPPPAPASVGRGSMRGGQEPQAPAAPPPLPPITLKLVAIVQGSGRPIAALSDGRDVFYGREGDVVEGRYKIIKINVESIDISYVDGRGQRRLGLTG